MPRLENWSVVRKSPYEAPEVPARLSGNVYGHHDPRHFDGKLIVTSRVHTSNGVTVTTESGTVYELGKVDPAYAAWAKENLGLDIDPENPVTVEQL